MSFLDELKRQAQTLQSSQQSDAARLERNTRQVEEACETAFLYWLELAQQLNVLQPASGARHALDAANVFEALPMRDFRVDARRQSLNGPQLHDVLHFGCRIGNGQAVSLSKDFPPEIEKLERRLSVAGIRFESEIVREADTERYLCTRYEFRLDFLAMVRLLPQHEHGLVRFQVDNFEGFGRLEVEMPAPQVSRALLDELAKLILGLPNGFAQAGRALRRD